MCDAAPGYMCRVRRHVLRHEAPPTAGASREESGRACASAAADTEQRRMRMHGGHRVPKRRRGMAQQHLVRVRTSMVLTLGAWSYSSSRSALCRPTCACLDLGTRAQDTGEAGARARPTDQGLWATKRTRACGAHIARGRPVGATRTIAAGVDGEERERERARDGERAREVQRRHANAKRTRSSRSTSWMR